MMATALSRGWLIQHHTLEPAPSQTIGRAPIAFRVERLHSRHCTCRGLSCCSYKGGMPGFARVVDEQIVVFPDYSGNESSVPKDHPLRLIGPLCDVALKALSSGLRKHKILTQTHTNRH